MCIEVLNAYKFSGKDGSIVNIMRVLEKIKAESEENAKKFFTDMIARDYVSRLDMYKYYGNALFRSKKDLVENDNQASEYKRIASKKAKSLDCINLYIYWELVEYYSSLKAFSDKAWPSHLEVFLFPLKDKTLAVSQSHTNLMGKSFEKYFDSYYYTSFYDKPDDVSDKEWKERKKDWEKAVGNDGEFRRHGLKFEMFDLEDKEFQCKVLFKNEYRKEAVKKAESDVSERIRNIRDTFEQPDTANSEEYKKWAVRQNRKIAKKLGLELPDDFCL